MTAVARRNLENSCNIQNYRPFNTGTGTEPKRTKSETGTFILINKVPEPNRNF